MQINASVYLPFPRALVYATYRDKLLDLVAQMPNVKRVVLKSRQESEGSVRQVFEWHGKSEIPAMLRAFVSEELLSWTDDATWQESPFVTDWSIRPHAFSEAIHWAGQDRYLEEGSGTRVESRGSLWIDPKQLQNVPGFLAGQVSHIAEEILAKQAEPNFIEMAKQVQSYLSR